MSKQVARKNESLLLPGYYYDKKTYQVFSPFSETRNPEGRVAYIYLVAHTKDVSYPRSDKDALMVGRADFLINYECCTHLIKIDDTYWPIIDVQESEYSKNTYNISYGSGIKNSANLSINTVFDFWNGHEDDIFINMQISKWRTPEGRIKFMRDMIGPFLMAVELKPKARIHAWYVDGERTIKENWPAFAYSRYKIVPDEDDED